MKGAEDFGRLDVPVMNIKTAVLSTELLLLKFKEAILDYFLFSVNNDTDTDSKFRGVRAKLFKLNYVKTHLKPLFSSPPL